MGDSTVGSPKTAALALAGASINIAVRMNDAEWAVIRRSCFVIVRSCTGGIQVLIAILYQIVAAHCNEFA